MQFSSVYLIVFLAVLATMEVSADHFKEGECALDKHCSLFCGNGTKGYLCKKAGASGEAECYCFDRQQSKLNAL